MSYKGKLSQYVCYLEPKVRELSDQGLDLKKDIIFVNPADIPNQFLNSIYEKNIQLLQLNPKQSYLNRLILKLLYSLNYVGYKNIQFLTNHLYADSTWIWNDLEPSIQLTEKQYNEGENLLRSMGINQDEEFAIIHLREKHYYDKHVDKTLNKEASSNFDQRNPDIVTYKKAIKFLISKNIKVIKTGFPGSTCNLKLDGFIDYANNFRTEFGDIYLHAKAKFVISGAAGNFQLAHVFGTPSILTNSYDYEVKPQLYQDMILPVVYKDNLNDLLCSFTYVLNKGVEISSSKFLNTHSLSLIHNDEDEIYEAVKEMLAGLDNSDISSKNHKQNYQQIFNSLYDKRHIGYGLHAKVSSHWLDKYNCILR
jgi:putative glycosyltransferase (TIGR04372 family)